MKHPSVSIIILTKNAGNSFKRVLDGIFSQSYKNFEVIIIDSGSKDNTLKICKKYPVRIIEIKPEEFGHGKTRNFGAKLAKGKYLVYVTHDAIPQDKNWLSELIKPLKDKGVAGVYSRQVPKNNEKILDKYFYLSLYPKSEIIWTKDFSQGDNIFSDVSSAIKKDVLLKNPFDNHIIVTEDYEWAQRVLRKGYKLVYNPKSKIVHSHSYDLSKLFKRCFDIGVSYKKIYTSKSKNNFIKNGVKVHINELDYLMKNNKSHLIPYCVIKDITRFAAVNLGKNHQILPNRINKGLSNYPGYWE